MQSMSLNDLVLYFGAQDRDAVALIRQACEKSVPLIHKYLGLDAPKDCRVYVMTSWLAFIFHSAPWPWKALLLVSFPLWAIRARKIWPLAGGWELRYGHRVAVGVKPPRLLQLADTSIGDRLFVKMENIDDKVQSITCHELTHAFTSHLQLPMWLKEGLAMVMVDKFFGVPTVRYETIGLLEQSSDHHNPKQDQRLKIENEDALLELYARSYWQTRYLEETQPELLKTLLTRRFQHHELESKIAIAYEKRREGFWGEIHDSLIAHFEQRS